MSMQSLKSFCQRLVQRLYERRFSTYCMYHRAALQKRIRAHGSWIVVYSGVKTGSSAMVAALRNSMPPGTYVFHVHFLAEPQITQWGQYYRRHFQRIGRVPHAFFESQFLRAHLNERSQDSRLKLVCGIRDPIEQLVSWFFYEAEIFGSLSRGSSGRHVARRDDYGIESMLEHFYGKKCSVENLMDGHLLGWFEAEFKPVAGVDIAEQGFDREARYKVYSGNGCEVLVFRTKDLTEIADQATEELTGVSGCSVVQQNSSRTRLYSDVYGEFKERVVIPEKLLNAAYSHPVIRATYSETEIAHMRQKWEHSGEGDSGEKL